MTKRQKSLPASDQQSRSGNDLFFDALVRSYVEKNPRFLRREWLAEELNAKMQEAGRRFVLLTAEPGAGKSSFMAQLAGDHPDWLRYFIRHDQRAVLADVSDKSLLLRIGYQLAALRPELFSQEELRVSVVQRIGQVGEQAEIVGAEVKRLTASPFYQKVLEIEQQVRTNQGNVVGLRVEELIVESRLLAAEDLLHLALIHPARALQRIDEKQQIVILIDALDEIRYHPTAENILAWLTNCPELPENIRFVLTSRPPDDPLKLFCKKQAAYLGELAITEEDAHVKEDIGRFVTDLVGEPAVAQALQEAKGGKEAFAEKAVAKAHGNLGYLDALARGIDQALVSKDPQTLEALLSLEELPADLEGLYDFFLHQIKASVARERIEIKDAETGEIYDKPVWPAVYDRILGVLAVAIEPVDIELIERLGELRAERTWVLQAVERLLQFLDVTNNRYRLYHATVAEFLTADKTRVNAATTDLYQDAKQRHRQIADHYWVRYSKDWTRCRDDYALRNLGRHLYATFDNERLQRLICKGWMDARQGEGERALTGFADDVGLGWQSETAQELPASETLVRLVAARLLIDERASSYGDAYLEALVWRDRAGESISLARGRIDPDARFRGLLTIYKCLTEKQRAANALFPDPKRRDGTTVALVEALDTAAHAIDSPLGRSMALSELGASLVKTGVPDGYRFFDEADAIVGALHDAGGRVHGYRTLAECLADAGDLRAGPMFSRAAEAAARDRTYLQILAEDLSRPGLEGQIEEFAEIVEGLESASDKDYLLGWLSQALISLGRVDEAETMISVIRAEERVQSLCHLARTLSASEPARAVQLLHNAAVVAATHSSSIAQAYDLGSVAADLANLNDPRADELFSESEEAANDPEMPAFNRAFALSHLVVNLVKGGRYGRANEIAESLRNPNLRREMNEQLVEGFASVGRFDEAESIAQSIPHLDARDRALSQLSSSLIRAGRFERAEQVTMSIGQTLGRQEQAVGELVSALTREGQFDHAIRVARSMPMGDARPDVLATLATVLSKAGDHRGEELLGLAAEATLVSQMREGISGRDAALRELSAGLSCREEYLLAEGVARLIDNAKEKAFALVTLASQLKKSNAKQADGLLDEAEEGLDAPISTRFAQLLHDLSFDTGKDLVDPNLMREASRRLREFSEELAEAGELERARRLALSIEDPDERVAALTRLAAVLARAGSPNVHGVIADATATAGSIPDKRRRAELLVQLAASVTDVGLAVADASVSKAIQVVDELGNSVAKIGMVCDLAVSSLKWSCPHAQGLCREAWALAQEIKDGSREDSYARVAAAFSQVGDFSEATRIIAQIQNPGTQGRARADLAVRLAETGALEQAQEAAAPITEGYQRARAFRHIAAGFIKANRAGADELLGQCQETAIQVPDKELRSSALAELSSSLAHFGFLGRAATVVEEIQTAERRNDALYDLAGAYVREGRVREALTTIAMRSVDTRAGSAQPLDDLLRIVASWMEHLERVQLGLSLAVLNEVLDVGVWIRPDWSKTKQLVYGNPAKLG